MEVGKTGNLIEVLRTTNTIDTGSTFPVPNNHPYIGAERSDIHAAAVIDSSSW